MNISTVKQAKCYFYLRKKLFAEDIKLWLKQVEHLLILSVIFLGTALPALFYLLLLAFGIVFKNEPTSSIAEQTSVSHLLMIIWCMIAVQSIFLLLLRQFILSFHNQTFLNSLGVSQRLKVFTDLIFGVICSPCLVLCIVVIFNIAPENYIQIPHGFILLTLLILSLYMCLYKPITAQYSLLTMLVAIFLLPSIFPTHDQTTWSILTMLVICLLTSIVVELVNPWFQCRLRFQKNGQGLLNYSTSVSSVKRNLWFSIATEGKNLFPKLGIGQNIQLQSMPFLLTIIGSSIVFIMTSYSAEKLPQFASVVYLIGTQVCLLFTTSLQLGIEQRAQKYALFLKSVKMTNTLNIASYILVLSYSVIVLCVFIVVSGRYELLYCIITILALIAAAKYSKQFFIAAWVVTSLILTLLY